MSTAFRIALHPNSQRLGPETDAAKDYVGRLIRLIPGEIVALYLAGRAPIVGYYAEPTRAHSAAMTWVVWTAFCLACLLMTRILGTKDAGKGIPPAWKEVGIAAVSFVVWVYSCGDVFDIAFDIWNPLAATLLVFAWTFLTPYFYNPNKSKPAT